MIRPKAASIARWTALLVVIAAWVPIATSPHAAEFGPPPGVALSLNKLARIDEFINGQVKAGAIPGAILLIQRHGKPVYF